jgi:hypothetical protein
MRRALLVLICSVVFLSLGNACQRDSTPRPATASSDRRQETDVSKPGELLATASPEWERLISAANVVLALRMDERDSYVSNGYGSAIGSIRGSVTRPVYDRVVGGIRFDLPPMRGGQDSSNISGAWFANFGKLFGANQAFRVRWKQRFNRVMVETFFRDSQGEPQAGIKQAIIGSGDLPGKPYASCTTPDVVAQTYYQYRFTQLYHGCGRYWGLYGSPVFAFQNQMRTNGAYCNYDATTAEGLKGNSIVPPAACARWQPDVWMVFAIEIANGPYANGRYTWSRAKFFVGMEGAPLRLVHDWDSKRDAEAEWHGLGFFAGDYAAGERFGKVWFTPYMTEYSGGHTELAQTWYKELIVTDETASMATATPMTSAPSIAAGCPQYRARSLCGRQREETVMVSVRDAPCQTPLPAGLSGHGD